MRHRFAIALTCVSFAYLSAQAQENSATATPAASKKTINPEDFLDLRNIQDPQFSPDGSRIVFVVSDPLKREKRTTHLWVYERSAASARQLTFSVKSELLLPFFLTFWLRCRLLAGVVAGPAHSVIIGPEMQSLKR